MLRHTTNLPVPRPPAQVGPAWHHGGVDPTDRPVLVLASGSPARRRLLGDAGLGFEVQVSGAQEDDVPTDDVVAAVATLAARKADLVAAGRTTGLVLGCDSLFEVDGTAVGKPSDSDHARRRLRGLRNRSGVLHTGHCLVDAADGRRVEAVASTTVRFGDPTDDEIDAYVATGEALGVAGGITIDGRSAPFIDGIEGDHTNVIGLSLPLLRRLLARLDVAITDLWRDP